MSTVIPFSPSPFAPFQFSPVLDGITYNAIITWNIFRAGQGSTGWYLNLYDQNGDLVLCRSLVGSPAGINIQSLTWQSGKAIITTEDPHGWPIGVISYLTLAGNLPDAINGIFPCLSTAENVLSFPLQSAPGNASQLGTVGFNIDLVAGYFTESTLVYRDGAQQFEITL